MTYPYQRLALPCGCREIVTGPGAIDEFACDRHRTRDGSTALVEARMDAFGHMAVFQFHTALEQIYALDFQKQDNGRDDFYSGPSRFIRAWMIAAKALDRLPKEANGAQPAQLPNS